MATTDRIRGYIPALLTAEMSADQIDDDLDLLGDLLDSVGLFRLIAFLEEEFSVVIEDEEITPQNFGTVARMAALVESKRSG